MDFSTVFFDLDDTLYPASSGLWPAIKGRMNQYMHEKVGIPLDEIPVLREKYFRLYGTTLRGLEANHQVDVADFLAYVHALPLHEYLSPDPLQQKILSSLGTRNFVFTNADKAHAGRVLKALQLEPFFESVVDVNAMAPYCKPNPESFAVAMQLSGETDPSRCVILDDLTRTTRAAREFGMFAILYGNSQAEADADACLTDWSMLPALLNGRS